LAAISARRSANLWLISGRDFSSAASPGTNISGRAL
jgi:hypothetical protein